MRSFWFVTVFLGLGFNSFADEFGQQVPIYLDDEGPRFSVLYAYDFDEAWMINFSLWAGDIAQNHRMTSLAWRLFDTSSDQFINRWTTVIDHGSAMSYPGTLAFALDLEDKTEILRAIGALRSLKLVLSVDQSLVLPRATHYIDLGSYCGPFPGRFINLTEGSLGCD